MGNSVMASICGRHSILFILIVVAVSIAMVSADGGETEDGESSAQDGKSSAQDGKSSTQDNEKLPKVTCKNEIRGRVFK